jgi:hypothetical protein
VAIQGRRYQASLAALEALIAEQDRLGGKVGVSLAELDRLLGTIARSGRRHPGQRQHAGTRLSRGCARGGRRGLSECQGYRRKDPPRRQCGEKATALVKAASGG